MYRQISDLIVTKKTHKEKNIPSVQAMWAHPPHMEHFGPDMMTS